MFSRAELTPRPVDANSVPMSHGKMRMARNQSAPARAPHDAQPSPFSHYLMRPILRLGPMAFAAAVTGVLLVAWLERDEGHITAESGIGYWLGICGAVVMVMLVGYPLRKRFKMLHGVGRVANWFRLHMVMGIAGPAMVIVHTNFNLGSLNSRLALITMLIVVASGIVGRYLYAKVHKGLYGRQAEIRDVLADIMALKTGLGAAFSGDPAISGELERYAPKNMNAAQSLAAGFTSALLTGLRTRHSRRRVLRAVEGYLDQGANGRSITRRQRRAYLSEIDGHLKIYFAAVAKAQRFAFFERLFSLWHHLHVPLFTLLALTVTLHIIAVHLY